MAYPDAASCAVVCKYVNNEILRTAKNFDRKFFSVQIQNGIKIRKGLDGYVESIERSDFMTQDLRNTIEEKIRGRIRNFRNNKNLEIN